MNIRRMSIHGLATIDYRKCSTIPYHVSYDTKADTKLTHQESEKDRQNKSIPLASWMDLPLFPDDYKRAILSAHTYLDTYVRTDIP